MQSKQLISRSIDYRNQLIGHMRDRQEKQADLALVNMHVARLVEQCDDLIDQAITLKASKQAENRASRRVTYGNSLRFDFA